MDIDTVLPIDVMNSQLTLYPYKLDIWQKKTKVYFLHELINSNNNTFN